MPEHHLVHLHLVPGDESQPIAGRVVDANGHVRAIASWVALIELLQDIRAHGQITWIDEAGVSTTRASHLSDGDETVEKGNDHD